MFKLLEAKGTLERTLRNWPQAEIGVEEEALVDTTGLFVLFAFSDLLVDPVYPVVLGARGVQGYLAQHETFFHRVYACGSWCHLLDRVRGIGLGTSRV